MVATTQAKDATHSAARISRVTTVFSRRRKESTIPPAAASSRKAERIMAVAYRVFPLAWKA